MGSNNPDGECPWSGISDSNKFFWSIRAKANTSSDSTLLSLAWAGEAWFLIQLIISNDFPAFLCRTPNLVAPLISTKSSTPDHLSFIVSPSLSYFYDHYHPLLRKGISLNHKPQFAA